MEFEVNSKEPIYIQIKNHIKMKIVSGELKEGERLLSVRDYATELKVNPNTISRVYSELEMENLITTQRGIGKFVTEDKSNIQLLKMDFSREIVKDFIRKSRTLGLSKDEIIELLSQMYEEDCLQ
ncbi:MAG: GntR family transcriptional regulator [Clostridium sp.]|nr:GntR family transcriptional regulator [Clostridium sp.]